MRHRNQAKSRNTQPHTLSLCLIVKDEELHLDYALHNTHLYADEIVVVDTGSTDKTKEIARKYTRHIYDFPWRNDFSAARNFALSKCTKAYIMWLDADDVIHDKDARKIHTLMQQPQLADVYVLPYYYTGKPKGKFAMLLYRESIFKNNSGFLFRDPIHEYLDRQKKYGDFSLETVSIPIYHKNKKTGKDKYQRNLTIALQAIKKKAYKNDIRMWGNIAGAYRALGQNELSKQAYKTAFTKVSNDTHPRELSQMHFELASMLFGEGKIPEALKHAKIAMEVLPSWREPFFLAAQLHYLMKEYEQSIVLLSQCKSIRHANLDNIIDMQIYSDRNIDLWIAEAYLRMGSIGLMSLSLVSALKKTIFFWKYPYIPLSREK